jgi:type IV pilus assembly protein PilM
MAAFVQSLSSKLQRWIAEPPPAHVFEVTERSLAAAPTKDPGRGLVELLPERGLLASPSTPNVVRPDVYRELIVRLAGPAASKRASAALVIPDYAVRMSVLDFQEFPAGETERDALLRFRLRKSVPFHIDEAQVSYKIQRVAAGRLEVLAVAIARPILAEYEDLMRQAGFQVGLVTPSCLAGLPLFANRQGLTLAAKLAGSVVSMLLLQGGHVRVVRCLDLAGSPEDGEVHTVRPEAIVDLLQQTAAYAEDQIGEPVRQLLLCGFSGEFEAVAAEAELELSLPCESVKSRFGVPSQEDAGLLGLVEQYAA